MAETRTNGKTKAKAKPAEKPAGADREHVCSVAFCPIGMALSGVQQVRPEAIEHLLVAGRELLLAAKAVIDARAEDLAEGGRASGLERIEIA